jgi:autotransporter adhesin
MNILKRKVIITGILLSLSGGAFAVNSDYLFPPPQDILVVDINNSTGSSIVSGNNGVIFGQGSTCYSDNCVITGNGSTSGTPLKQLGSSLINGSGSTNTADLGTVLGNGASNTAYKGVAIGDGTANTVVNNVSVGGRTIGSVLNASTADQAVNLGQVNSLISAIGGTQNPVSYDNAGKSSITLNNGNASVQVKNVAYATQNTDAANLQNVRDITQNYYNQTTNDISVSATKTLNQANSYTDQAGARNLTQANSYTDQSAARTLTQANNYTDQKVGAINNRIDKIDQRLNGVGAMAMASSSLTPNPHIASNNQIALAVGSYGGASAIAGAIYHYNQTKTVQYNVRFSAGTNGGGSAIGAGVAFGF